MKIRSSKFAIRNSVVNIGEHPSGIANSKGVALIMVLWVIAVLSLIVLEFSFAMRTEVNVSRHYKEEVQLHAYAEGGIHRAIAELINKNDPKIQQMRKAMITALEEIPPEKREWITDGRPYVVSYDQGSCEIRVVGEAGKVNINTASDPTLRKIVGQFGLEGEARDVVVDSILDWIDADDFTRINGAENDYYRSLKEPYNCKSAPMDSIEELLLVRGVTRDLFYGKRQAKKEEGEQPGDVTHIGLRDLFSIYSSGEQVDVNSASLPVLKIVLGLPELVTQSILRARGQSLFLNEQDFVQRVPEMAAMIADKRQLITYQSVTPYYTVESRGKTKQGGAVQGIKVIVKIDSTEKTGYKIIQWLDRLL